MKRMMIAAILISALTLAGCVNNNSALNENLTSGAIVVSDRISLRGGGQDLGRTQVSLGIAAGTDRTDTIYYDVTVSVDPSKVNLRRFNEDSVIRVDLLASLEIQNNVTGDILVTRNLPRTIRNSDEVTLLISEDTGWQATRRLTYGDIPLARTVNVFGLQGTSVTNRINQTTVVTSVSLE